MISGPSCWPSMWKPANPRQRNFSTGSASWEWDASRTRHKDSALQTHLPTTSSLKTPAESGSLPGASLHRSTSLGSSAAAPCLFGPTATRHRLADIRRMHAQCWRPCPALTFRVELYIFVVQIDAEYHRSGSFRNRTGELAD